MATYLHSKYPLISATKAEVGTPEFKKEVDEKIELIRDALNNLAVDTSAEFNGLTGELNFESGVATLTGGGGDLTITLSNITDWTGGYLVVHLSATSTKYYRDAAGGIMRWETSYIALTDAGYTTDQTVRWLQHAGAADAGIQVKDKTENFTGNPKSATTTSFTLDDAGATYYIKWFVWA